MGARVTGRKDFAGRRSKLIAATQGARRLMSESGDHGCCAVRRAALEVLDLFEARIDSGTGLNPRTLPRTAELKLYSPLRRFFHDDVPDQVVRRISQAQEDGLGALADLFHEFYADPQSIKRSAPAVLASDPEIVAEQCRHDIINVAEYVRLIFDVSIAATPVRRSTKQLLLNDALQTVVERTEQTRVAEPYCLLCRHRPSQLHQALTEYQISIVNSRGSKAELFVLGNRVPLGAKLKPLTTKLSPLYCDLHAGSSLQARRLRRYAMRHAADIAVARANSLGWLTPISGRDRRLIRFLRGQPARIAEEVSRLEEALSAYRPDIESLMNYYLSGLPMPSAVRDQFSVNDRFAALEITSSGAAYCLDIDREITAEFYVNGLDEPSSWTNSFNRLQALARYFPGGLRDGDNFWVTRSHPTNADDRVAIANVCFWTICQHDTAGAIVSSEATLQITATSPQWLRIITAGMSHQHPLTGPQRP